MSEQCPPFATKDELQELRDQLNEAFAQKEGGGKDEIFKAGAPLAGGLIQGAGTVRHTQYALQAAHDFAGKAWKATKADKVIYLLGTVASLHNAAMLSQNVAQSLGDTATAGLSLFNITAPGGETIDVNAVIGGTVRSKLESIFGTAVLNTASATWLKINRIHQAIGATVNAIQGTKNALLEADEITGGNVARIGNALMEQGVIEDDTYDYMNDEPDYQTPLMRATFDASGSSVNMDVIGVIYPRIYRHIQRSFGITNSGES